jgi:hypothetical protein
MSVAQSIANKTTFRVLIGDLYIQRLGLVASTALTLVSVRSGVSLGAVWSAYRGFRVSPDTALRLKDWAFAEHGVEDLDVEQLITAPSRPRRGPR